MPYKFQVKTGGASHRRRLFHHWRVNMAAATGGTKTAPIIRSGIRMVLAASNIAMQYQAMAMSGRRHTTQMLRIFQPVKLSNSDTGRRERRWDDLRCLLPIQCRPPPLRWCNGGGHSCRYNSSAYFRS